MLNTVETIVPYLKEQQLIVLESTTYPGTTEELLLPKVESTGLTVGENIYLAHSPEREDPGNANHSTQTIPKVVAGVTEKCRDIAVALYQNIIDSIVPVSLTRSRDVKAAREHSPRSEYRFS